MFVINSIVVNGKEYNNIEGKSLNAIMKQLKVIKNENAPPKKPKKVKKLVKDKVIEKLNNEDLSDNTKKKYIVSINALFETGDLIDVDLMLKFIIDKYTNISTLKFHLSALMKVYKLFNLDTQYKKVFEVFESYKNNEVVVEKESKPITEAIDIMKNVKETYKQLKRQMTNNYDENRMYAFVGCLFLEHGVLRGDELIYMFISESENSEYPNYIDLKNKKMIIGKHKTIKKTGIRTIDLSDKCIQLIRDYPNRFLITKKNGDLYSDATGFSKRLEVIFGSGNYAIRDAKSSINLKGVKNSVANAQGHSISVMNEHYRKYK